MLCFLLFFAFQLDWAAGISFEIDKGLFCKINFFEKVFLFLWQAFRDVTNFEKGVIFASNAQGASTVEG